LIKRANCYIFYNMSDKLENPEKRRYRRVEFKALLHSLIHRPADVSIKIIGNDTKVVMLDLSEDGMAI